MVRQQSGSYIRLLRADPGPLIRQHGYSRSRDREGGIWLLVEGSQGSVYRCNDGGSGAGK